MIPDPALRRLPKYRYFLQNLKKKNILFVSCTHLSKALDVDPTLVRKDLSFTGVKGKPKIGFPVNELIIAIETFLNFHNDKEAIIAGVGNLGTALLGYNGFSVYGLRIVAAFDTDPKKIGQEINGISVYDSCNISSFAADNQISVGIITVPARFAQGVAKQMVAGGIKGIWNFASIEIKASSKLTVVNENLASSLSVLSHKINQL